MLKTQIENLKELDPMKIREYSISIKEQLEEYIEELKSRLTEAKTEIKQKSTQIEKLKSEGDKQSEVLKKLEYEKTQIEGRAMELYGKVKRVETLVDLRPINFIKFLNDIIDSFEKRIPKRNIKIERLYSSENIDCLIDVQRFEQVVVNLLENACEALPNGGLIQIFASTGTNCVDYGPIEEEVILRIRDNGIGMSEEVKKKLFTPFFTTKEKGSGLGLAVVKKIVSAHEGYIKIDSQLGKGTTVAISFPKNA